jgi:hypothetical protein
MADAPSLTAIRSLQRNAPPCSVSFEQPLQFLVDILSGVDQMGDYEPMRVIERIHDPVLRAALGEME